MKKTNNVKIEQKPDASTEKSIKENKNIEKNKNVEENKSIKENKKSEENKKNDTIDTIENNKKINKEKDVVINNKENNKEKYNSAENIPPHSKFKLNFNFFSKLKKFGSFNNLSDSSKNKYKKNKQKKNKNVILKIFSDFFERLGHNINARELNRKLLLISGGISAFLALAILIISIINLVSFSTCMGFLLAIGLLVFPSIYFVSVLVFFMYFDIVMYRRTKQIEEVLPDFLQLVSANINAGMTIERALWFAIRPKFGILAKEIEDVAKATVAGEDLDTALLKFANKYESRLLKEAINLLIAGANAGGRMADLLNKISLNVKETQLMRKEISASVTSYSIFIGVATIGAAPMLLALSTELLKIVKQITSSIHLENTVGVNSLFSFNFSSESITIAHFQNFALMILIISSFFSAAIISTIRNGSVKDGIKLIPLFMVVSIVLYYLSYYVLDIMMSGIMGLV